MGNSGTLTVQEEEMTERKAGVFKETYANYLRGVSGLDLGKISGILGGEIRDNGLLIPYFNREYTVSSTGVTNSLGATPDFAISVVLLKYVLMAPLVRPIPRGEWRSFRDFADAGPLVTYFSSNAIKALEQAEWKKARAARMLGISRGTVYNKMLKYGIKSKL